MDRKADFFQRRQKVLQSVGKLQGGSGVCKEKSTAYKKENAQDHQDGPFQPFFRYFEDPPAGNDLPLCKEKVQDRGKDDDKQEGLHAL